MTWRESCGPLIAKTIKENQGKPLKEIKKALREVYPFGVRRWHPYKIWCDEIKIQLGLKKKKRLKDLNQLELELK